MIFDSSGMIIFDFYKIIKVHSLISIILRVWSQHGIEGIASNVKAKGEGIIHERNDCKKGSSAFLRLLPYLGILRKNHLISQLLFSIFQPIKERAFKVLLLALTAESDE